MGNTNKYFTISEIAKEFDVKKSHIRFCEEKKLISPRVSKMGRRVYSEYDRARLKLIFHCVLVGYSQEQIVDLIGLSDATLDPNDQVRCGIEYAQKKIGELEHRKNEAKFHERTSIMTELNMMWEYIEEIKTLKPKVPEEKPLKAAVQIKKKEEKKPKPVKEAKPKTERTPESRPGRMIPLFAAGAALVLAIGGYFYYQAGQRETTTIKLAQTERVPIKKHPVYHEPVPSDQMLNPEITPSETQETPPLPSQNQPDNLKPESSKSASAKIKSKKPVQKESSPGVLKAKKSLENQSIAKKKSIVSSGGALIVGKAGKTDSVSGAEKMSDSTPKAESAKLPEVNAKKPTKSETAVEVATVTKKAASALEKQKISTSPAKPVPKAGIKEIADLEKPAVKRVPSTAPVTEKKAASAPQAETKGVSKVETKEAAKPVVEAAAAAPVTEKMTASAPQAETKGVSKVETKEAAKPETAIKVVPVVGAGAALSENQKDFGSQLKQIPGTKLEEKTSMSSDQVASVSGEDSSVPQKEQVASDEVKEASSEPEKEKEVVASKENILEKETQAAHLKSFLAAYCETYENKDLDKFFTFFAPDATENDKPFKELKSRYRKNMEMIDSFKYRIELIAYSVQDETGNIRMQGKFFARYLLHGGAWKDNSGDISMELVENGDSFLVKQLKYGK